MTAVIGASHVLCAIGSGTEQVWASARAGIARIGNSHVMDRHFEPIQMGLVPEDALGELNPEIERLPLPSRARRMLRLATPSLKAVTGDLDTAVPLFIGLPQLTDEEAPWLKHVPAYLEHLTAIRLDRAQSVVIPRGRAAGLLALEQALTYIRADSTAHAIVGGVDTYLDLRLLATFDAEQRILGRRVMDGFIPGEGAGFLRLSGAKAKIGTPGEKRIVVQAVASAMDPGHRYGTEPAKGEGLSAAIATMRQMLANPAPVATTFAGFNGESFEGKLWGVARLRHDDLFAPGMVIEHPADQFGDVGAAAGTVLMALAAQSLQTGTREGPALVWAASDREPRACAIMSLS